MKDVQAAAPALGVEVQILQCQRGSARSTSYTSLGVSAPKRYSSPARPFFNSQRLQLAMLAVRYARSRALYGA